MKDQFDIILSFLLFLSGQRSEADLKQAKRSSSFFKSPGDKPSHLMYHLLKTM